MPYFRGNLMYHRHDSNYGVITPRRQLIRSTPRWGGSSHQVARQLVL